jgi:hypothetical protein
MILFLLNMIFLAGVISVYLSDAVVCYTFLEFNKLKIN